jgi:hypothetical protein
VLLPEDADTADPLCSWQCQPKQLLRLLPRAATVTTFAPITAAAASAAAAGAARAVNAVAERYGIDSTSSISCRCTSRKLP